MLGDAVALGLGADHEARDVLEEDERDAALGAELDEVGALLGRGGEEDAVVGDDADLVAVDGGEAGDEGLAEVALELGEVGAVDDAGDDLADGQRLAEVGGGDAEELLRVVEGLGEGGCRDGGGRGGGRPVEVRHGAAGERDGVGVVDGEVVGHAGHGAVHLAAAEVLGADLLARRGLDQRRAREEDVALPADDDALVRHGGHVRTPRSAGPHDDGDLRDALGGHARLVVEDAAEVVLVREDVGLLGQVGAAAVDEVQAGQLVLLGDGLGAQVLLDGDGVVRAALDGAVVGDDDARDALDDAHARDDAARGHVGLRVQLEAGERAQLEEGRARVDEGGDAVPRQHLVALDVLLARLLGPAALDAGRQVVHAGHERVHGGAVVPVLVRGGVDGRGQALDGGGVVGWGEVRDGAALLEELLAPGELAALAEGLLGRSGERHAGDVNCTSWQRQDTDTRQGLKGKEEEKRREG